MHIDNGRYYCYYSGATDLENDKENVDSIHVFVHSEGKCPVLDVKPVIAWK